MMSTSVLVTLLALAVVRPQTPAGGGVPACNDLTRTLARPAGPSSAVTQQCPRITVSVAGASFSTPSSCIVAYSDYLASVYTCGPAAPGIHCKARGYKATIKNYTGGGCPDVAGLTNGMSWASWSDVPSDLVAIIQGMSSCVPPEEQTTFDWSASTMNCDETLAATASLDEDRVGADGRPIVSWYGDPRELFLERSVRDPFRTPFDAAMEGGGGVTQGRLRELVERFAPIPGVSFVVEVEIRHFEQVPSQQPHLSSFVYEGELAAAGTFDLVRTGIATGEGETVLTRCRWGFDGRVLTYATSGSEEGVAYGDAFARDAGIWSVEVLPYLKPLYAWLRNPLAIPGFSDLRYVEESRDSLVLVKRIAKGSAGSFVSKIYAVEPRSEGGPSMRYSEILDEAGRPRERSSFARLQELAPRTWRPLELRHTLYLDGDRTGRRVQMDFHIRSARILSAWEAGRIAHRELPAGLRWNVWR